MHLAFELEPEQAARLREEADRLGVSPADLAKAAVSNLLAHDNPSLAAVIERVLRKNHELYRRLA